MANEEHLSILRKGVEEWNVWRERNSIAIPDFTGGQLSDVYLAGADLYGARLDDADLTGANLSHANLCRASIREADLSRANLSFADLSRAHLDASRLSGACLRETDLSDARLIEVDVQEAEMRGANLTGADPSGSDLACASSLAYATLIGLGLSGVDFASCDLTNCDFRTCSLRDTVFSSAVLTGAKLWGTARNGWIIDGIRCDYVYWDEKGEERSPKGRDFEPGEFEALHKELSKFEVYFEKGFAPVDILLLDRSVQLVNGRDPGVGLHIETIDVRGRPHAVLSVVDGKRLGEAEDEITSELKAQVRALEGKQDQLQSLFEAVLRQPQLLMQGGSINMGDIINATNLTGDINIAKGHARQTIIKDGSAQKSVIPDAAVLVEAITKAIKDADADESLRGAAHNTLDQIDSELKKEDPKREVAQPLLAALGAMLPTLAEQMPAWGKMLGKIIGR